MLKAQTGKARIGHAVRGTQFIRNPSTGAG
ncbi:hypothetical protein HMPREF9450_00041 [Alistipes indistinctus YIT 12060]|uniref:Uncharacterized protein n=1 Tax=Alistipes indistinctus YIT 12060 TaxID=742725 RepID=G5H531_9BACT|nr:hypothetical protein HMPREF9450_00041 [Alistipes indistinctus YIT 12060]